MAFRTTVNLPSWDEPNLRLLRTEGIRLLDEEGKKMYRTKIILAGIFAAAMAGADSEFSHDISTYHYNATVVAHSGETDSNGCHEDGSGDYHCH